MLKKDSQTSHPGHLPAVDIHDRRGFMEYRKARPEPDRVSVVQHGSPAGHGRRTVGRRAL